MPDYIAPGVYIEEQAHLPPSIVSVDTAVPLFIGYTRFARQNKDDDLLGKPWHISSLLEFEQFFGEAPDETAALSVSLAIKNTVTISINEQARSPFLLHYALQLFFANGGQSCWIIAAGLFSDNIISLNRLQEALTASEKETSIPLLLIPDAMRLSSASEYYTLFNQALDQCARLQSRFLVMDVYHDQANTSSWENDTGQLTTALAPNNNRLFGAAYFPQLLSTVFLKYEEKKLPVYDGPARVQTLSDLQTVSALQYKQALQQLSQVNLLLPCAPAVAGAYVSVDTTRGVWKAPANINLHQVAALQYQISNTDQEKLDTATSVAINPIRAFTGKGNALVWGARTLDPNNVEFRYVPVRRTITMIEQSIRQGAQSFVFEPNDSNTWVRIKGMVENYFVGLWRQGALMGNKPEEAFFVQVGLNQSMTSLDILNGKLVILAGVALVRPAEFIIMRMDLAVQPGM